MPETLLEVRALDAHYGDFQALFGVSIKVDIGHLNVDDGVYVRDLSLPAGVTVDAEGDLLIVHVVVRGTVAEPTAEAAAAAAAEAVTQPEVIKPERKEKEKAD